MNMRSCLVGLGVGIAMSQAAWGSPTLTSELVVFDGVPADLTAYDPNTFDFSTPMAPVNGVIPLQAYKTYVVGVRVTLANPNMTDSLSGRAALTQNQPLGLQVTNAVIKSGGTSNAFGALLGTAQIDGFPTWLGYHDNTLLGAAYPWVNLNNRDADSDRDPDGVGIFNMSFNLASAAALPGHQIGVGGSLIVSGLYRTQGSGGGSLFTAHATALAYYDRPASSNELHGEDIRATVVNAPLQFEITPANPPPALTQAPRYAVLDAPIAGGGGSSVVQFSTLTYQTALNLDPAGTSGIESDTIYVMLNLRGTQSSVDGWLAETARQPDVTPISASSTGLAQLDAYASIFNDGDAGTIPVVLELRDSAGAGTGLYANIDVGPDLLIVSAAAAVPEPGTLGLLALGGLALLRRRR